MPKTIIPEHLRRKSPRHGEKSKAFRTLVAEIPIGQEWGRKDMGDIAEGVPMISLVQTLLRHGYVQRIRPGVFVRVKDIPALDSRRHFCKKSRR